MFSKSQTVANTDPELWAAIQKENQRQQDHIEPVRRYDRVDGVEQAQHRISNRLEEIEGEHGARNLSGVVAVGQRERSRAAGG